MQIQDYLRVARQYWFVIVGVTALVFGGAAAMTLTATPLYQATAAVYVSPNGSTPNELNQGTTFLQGQMGSYAELVDTSTVLNPVIEDLGLSQTARGLAGSISAKASSDSVILRVSATSDSPEMAAKLADAAAKSLSQRITELAPKRPEGNASIGVSLVQEATVPSKPFSPNTSRNLAAGMVAGLLLGYLAALLWAVLDTRLRTADQVRAVVKSPVLAEIPTSSNTVITGSSRGSYAEAFHRLRINLDFLDAGDRPLQLVVTSAAEGEGKSTVALNIARTCAGSGLRVLLIDADLRRPTVHKELGLDQSVGLSTVLAGKCHLAEATLAVGRGGNLHVLTSGVLPPNPTELIGSTAMESLLAETKHNYDVVIIDSPPVLPVVDALVLARKASGAILVARVGKVRRDELKRALESFQLFSSTLLGVVFNAVPKPDKSPYHAPAAPPPTPPKTRKPKDTSELSSVLERHVPGPAAR